MYITATEWAVEYGGKKIHGEHKGVPLPFDHCALSLTPFESPVCTPEGVVFDILNLTPFVRKHKSNPVTGEPMTTGEIIRLNMSKNSDGVWHCPVLYKVFNNNTHVVAIRNTGNVFSYDAVHELNIKAKNYFDLLTGEQFQKSDIITLQNPEDPAKCALRDIGNFKYLQNIREDTRAAAAAVNPVRHNPTSERVMKEHAKFMASEEGVARSKLSISSASSVTEYSADVDGKSTCIIFLFVIVLYL
jgi:peptidyl-prolyl cis-trans isomerase-like protein 2